MDTNNNVSDNDLEAKQRGSGIFLSRADQVHVDIQSGEVSRGRHAVSPVSDTVARSEDFKAIFGSQSQHWYS